MFPHSPSTHPSLIFRLALVPEDTESWRRFVFRYGPILLRWCRQYGLQEADAKDVSQEVLLRIARQIRRRSPEFPLGFRGWLRAIVHGAWCDWVEHSRTHRREVSGLTNSCERLQQVEAREDLLKRIDSRYDRELYDIAARRIRRSIEPQTWLAFQLQAVELLTPSEVGERLGIKPASAIAARYRVTKLMRDEIAGLEKAP
jgi:RNA polymerase sigma factor (sigma-70 family)